MRSQRKRTLTTVAAAAMLMTTNEMSATTQEHALVGTWGGMNAYDSWVEVQITEEHDDDTVNGTLCYIYANGVI